jgi:hypothetical protein
MAELEPNTPRWWLQRLGTQLMADRPRLDLLENYRCGNHPLPIGHHRMREAFRILQRKSRSNYTGLVVEAVKERAKPQGFRKGTAALDKESQRMWQANSLDAEAPIAHSWCLTYGRSYVIVGPPTKDNYDQPVISVEDPREVIHEPHPLRRRRAVAALKLYVDEIQGEHKAVVYTGDGLVYYFSRPKRKNEGYYRRFDQSKWVVDTSEYEGGFADLGIDRCPVIPFINRPDYAPMGFGEFEDVIDIQDRINSTILDRMVISRMQAYRQRWMKGAKLTDEEGNVLPPFDPGADLLWAVEDENVQFGDFETTDIRPLLDATKADVNDLAAISRTPPHYLLGALVNVSGDALTAAETGLVSKIKDRMVGWSESWEDVDRIGDLYMDREPDPSSALIWADPQFRSRAELSDAAVKDQAVGVPWAMNMERLGFTPEDIARMRSMRAEDALLTAAIAPGVSQPAPGPSGNQRTTSNEGANAASGSGAGQGGPATGARGTPSGP